MTSCARSSLCHQRHLIIKSFDSFPHSDIIRQMSRSFDLPTHIKYNLPYSASFDLKMWPKQGLYLVIGHISALSCDTPLLFKDIISLESPWHNEQQSSFCKARLLASCNFEMKDIGTYAKFPVYRNKRLASQLSKKWKQSYS